MCTSNDFGQTATCAITYNYRLCKSLAESKPGYTTRNKKKCCDVQAGMILLVASNIEDMGLSARALPYLYLKYVPKKRLTSLRGYYLGPGGRNPSSLQTWIGLFVTFSATSTRNSKVEHDVRLLLVLHYCTTHYCISV